MLSKSALSASNAVDSMPFGSANSALYTWLDPSDSTTVSGSGTSLTITNKSTASVAGSDWGGADTYGATYNTTFGYIDLPADDYVLAADNNTGLSNITDGNLFMVYRAGHSTPFPQYVTMSADNTSNGNYLAASRSNNTYYHANAGSPEFHAYNPQGIGRVNNNTIFYRTGTNGTWILIEFRGVNLSNWETHDSTPNWYMNFNGYRYSSFNQHVGVGGFLLFDRELTSTERTTVVDYLRDSDNVKCWEEYHSIKTISSFELNNGYVVRMPLLFEPRNNAYGESRFGSQCPYNVTAFQVTVSDTSGSADYRIFLHLAKSRYSVYGDIAIGAIQLIDESDGSIVASTGPNRESTAPALTWRYMGQNYNSSTSYSENTTWDGTSTSSTIPYMTRGSANTYSFTNPYTPTTFTGPTAGIATAYVNGTSELAPNLNSSGGGYAAIPQTTNADFIFMESSYYTGSDYEVYCRLNWGAHTLDNGTYTIKIAYLNSGYYQAEQHLVHFISMVKV